MLGERQSWSPDRCHQAASQEESDETGSNSTHADKCRGASTSENCWSRAGWGSGGVARRAAAENKVGASKPCSIARVDVDRAVAKKAAETELSRNVQVDVAGDSHLAERFKTGFGRDLRSVEYVDSDVAVLACQITNLAGFWLSGIARWDFATNEGVEMAKRGSAVAISRNWLVMDVVHCYKQVRKVLKEDGLSWFND